MSEVKVNKISPRTNCGTVTLGDSGDTFTIPSGATIQNLGTSTGFGGTGVVSWNTTKITADPSPAVTGTGYFCDTSGGSFTVTLPASPSAGDVVGVSDYAKTFDTYPLTLGRNSENIGGIAVNATLSTEGVAVTLVYVDSTKGWIVTDSGNQSDAPSPQYIAATGGCITTCGNYKMHTFYSPGTFCVSGIGNPAGGPNSVDYLIVAGGAGGAAGSTPGHGAGGGGAGGYRESPGAETGCYAVSPLGAAPAAAIAVTAQGYAVVVGGGGPSGPGCANARGTSGVDSSALGITSTGGGGGGGSGSAPFTYGATGGSGGGGSSEGPSPSGAVPSPTNGGSGGAGNDPSTNPAQGNPGGYGNNGPGPSLTTGAGGGALGAGGNGSPGSVNGAGGDGAGTAINLTTMPAPSPTPSAQIGTSGPSPSVRYFSGGGGGGGTVGHPTGGTAPYGGGSAGIAPNSSGPAGTINTGGGGGGGGGGPPVGTVGTNGGSGIVVIRYKYQ